MHDKTPISSEPNLQNYTVKMFQGARRKDKEEMESFFLSSAKCFSNRMAMQLL